jgi:hypothetical protein
MAKVMESSPPNVKFLKELLGPRLASWNALLQRLANVHLQEVPDEFCWNLHENGTISIGSMYNALNQLNIPIDKNSNDNL